MTKEIHRLVYYSTNRTSSSPDIMATTVEQILAASRRNNPRVDVTGALMFNAGCFAQILEGPQAAVAHTFERIQQDERHGNVSVLSFGPVEKRAFDRWSMAFIGASAFHARQYEEIAGASGYDPAHMTGDAIFETLRRLVLEEEGAHSE